MKTYKEPTDLKIPHIPFYSYKKQSINYSRIIMGSLEEEYKKMAEGEHGNPMGAYIYVLRRLSEGVEHITELGTGHFCSTRGFMASKPKKMVGIDIKKQIQADSIIQLAKNNGIDYEFIEADSISLSIEETDILLVDSKHTYAHALKEMNKHSSKTKKYIIIHDTLMEEILKAINDFLKQNNLWEMYEAHLYTTHLHVLKRR